MGAGLKNAETKSIRAYIDTKVTADIKTTVASPGLDTKVISEKAAVAYFEPKPATAVNGNLSKFDASKHIVDAGVATETTMTSGDTKVPTTGAVKKVTDPVVVWLKNHVQEGGLVEDGTTPSSHNEGTPIHDFNADISAGVYIVNGVMGYLDAVTDGNLSSGGTDPIDATDDTLYIAVVVKEATGTLSYQYVLGTAAPALSAVVPSDADITTAVTHARWIRIADFCVTRTGATTLTVTVDNTAKPVLA
jgi:hypothetical protein